MTLLEDVLPTVQPANDVPGPAQGCWGWDDLVALPDEGRRYEILDGVLFVTPPPETSHESTGATLIRYLHQAVVDPGLGWVFGSNCGVELRPGFVVLPDVAVVLQVHGDRITRTRIIGAPDLVVEILSPGTAGYDRREKQDAYEQAGVPEYWVADRAARTIEVLALEHGRYRSLGVFRGQATPPSRVLPAFDVPVEQLLPH